MDFLNTLLIDDKEDQKIEYVVNNKYYLIPEYEKTIQRFIKNKKYINYNDKDNNNNICDLFIQQLISRKIEFN